MEKPGGTDKNMFNELIDVMKKTGKVFHTGYMYRYNPANKEHPFTLDSKEPTMGYQEFLEGEVRYASLHKTFPQNAKALFAQAEIEAKERYESYRKMAQQD